MLAESILCDGTDAKVNIGERNVDAEGPGGSGLGVAHRY